MPFQDRSQEDIFSPENLYLCSRKAARRIQLVRLPLENGALSINFDRGRPEILTSHCTVFQYIPSFSFFLSPPFFFRPLGQTTTRFVSRLLLHLQYQDSFFLNGKRKKGTKKIRAPNNVAWIWNIQRFNQHNSCSFSRNFFRHSIYISISRHQGYSTRESRAWKTSNFESKRRKTVILFIVWAWKEDETT